MTAPPRAQLGPGDGGLGDWEPGRLGVPRGLSEAILKPVYWAAERAPPRWRADPAALVLGNDGDDGSGKLGQLAWEQKEGGGALGGKGASMGLQTAGKSQMSQVSGHRKSVLEGRQQSCGWFPSTG